jgi:hypothetical protein
MSHCRDLLKFSTVIWEGKNPDRFLAKQYSQFSWQIYVKAIAAVLHVFSGNAWNLFENIFDRKGLRENIKSVYHENLV